MKKLIIGYAIAGVITQPALANTSYATSNFQVPLDTHAQASTRPANTLESLRSAERLRESAMAQGDVTLLKSLFSEYYYHVESNGRVRSKTQLLLSVQRGEFKFLSYKVDEIEVRLTGLVAVATGRFTVTREVGPDKRHYTGRFIRIWEHDGNRWRNTMHQSTEVKPVAVNSAALTPTQ